MTRPLKRFTRPALAALFAVGFLGALISCSPEDETEAHTRKVAAATWGQQVYAERQGLCEEVVLYGADQAAVVMAPGLADGLDPEVTVQYMIERCGAEGLWPVWATDAPLPQ